MSRWLSVWAIDLDDGCLLGGIVYTSVGKLFVVDCRMLGFFCFLCEIGAIMRRQVMME
jgi:hypothetical protein